MLVLIAHGSRNDGWRQSLEALTTSVQQADPPERVRLAYMQFAGPTLEDVVQEETARGVESFRILPLFMASAGHVDQDIRPLIGTLAKRFPRLQFELLPPVGEHPRFHELIQTIAQEALQGGQS